MESNTHHSSNIAAQNKELEAAFLSPAAPSASPAPYEKQPDEQGGDNIGDILQQEKERKDNEVSESETPVRPTQPEYPEYGEGDKPDLFGEGEQPQQPPKIEEPAKPVDRSLSIRKAERVVWLKAQLINMFFKYRLKYPAAVKIEYDDDEVQMMAEAYLPLVETYGGKVPFWLEILFVEAIITGPKIAAASQQANEIKRQQQAVNNPAYAGSVKEAVQSSKERAQQAERTKFKIHANGAYTYSRDGKYLPIDDAKERVDLGNMEHVQRVIETNGLGKLQRAFPDIITTEWLQRHGITDNE